MRQIVNPLETEENQKRIHVATFDADGKEDYNRENCTITRDLYQNHPPLHGAKVDYWCEKGYFKE